MPKKQKLLVEDFQNWVADSLLPKINHLQVSLKETRQEVNNLHAVCIAQAKRIADLEEGGKS